MRKIAIILSICIMTTTTSCGSNRQQLQKISYKNPYDLTRLDFNMDVPYFMSGSILFKKAIMEDEDYGDDYSELNRNTKMYYICYWVEETLPIEENRRNEIDDNGNWIVPESRTWGILYSQGAYVLSEALATFHTIGFEIMNVVTDLDNNLMAVAVKSERLNSEETILKTIQYLNENFESMYVKDETYFKSDPRMKYRWEDNDLIYMMTVKKVRDTTIKLSFEEDEEGKLIDARTIPNSDDTIYTNVYFFIIKKEADEAIKNSHFMGIFSNL